LPECVVSVSVIPPSHWRKIWRTTDGVPLPFVGRKPVAAKEKDA